MASAPRLSQVIGIAQAAATSSLHGIKSADVAALQIPPLPLQKREVIGIAPNAVTSSLHETLGAEGVERQTRIQEVVLRSLVTLFLEARDLFFKIGPVIGIALLAGTTSSQDMLTAAGAARRTPILFPCLKKAAKAGSCQALQGIQVAHVQSVES